MTVLIAWVAAVLIAWVAAVAGLTAAGWLSAAYLFAMGHGPRTAMTILSSGVAFGGLSFQSWFGGGRGTPDPLEATIGAMFVLGAGIAGAVAALPFWFAIEERFGHRTPRP